MRSSLTRLNLFVLGIVALAFFGFACTAQAAVVVIDFTGAADGLVPSYSEDGFDINPIPPNSVIELKEVVFNQSLKVIPGQPNRDDDILTKAGGGVFTLNSFVVTLGIFDQGAAFSVFSSAGGVQAITATGLYTFAGPDWTNITSISFVNTAGTTSSKTGFINVDDITLNDEPVIIDEPQVVPEPGSLAMMCVGAAGFAGYWIRRRRQTATV